MDTFNPGGNVRLKPQHFWQCTVWLVWRKLTQLCYWSVDKSLLIKEAAICKCTEDNWGQKLSSEIMLEVARKSQRLKLCFFSKHWFIQNFFYTALILFCKCLMMQNRIMFLIVIGYDDNVKGIFSCLNVLSFPFVYFGSPCLYRYESTKSKLLIGWL